jgi:acyl-CoA dehydrogenase
MGISFALTDEQRELQRAAREFAARELRPIAAQWDERENYPPDLLGKAASVGLTSYAIPAEHGGGGADSVTSALISEELSWGCAGLAATIQATMFPVRPLLRFGTDAQRTRYLPLLAREEGALAAIAFTEAQAGSDLSATRAEARRDGDAYVLSGEKVYVTNGGIADLTVVFAKLDGELTAFLLEAGDPGVTAGRKERKLGLRASYTGSVVLDGARLPADRLVGREGQGLEIALDFFQASRPQVAAGAVGVARAAFEHATGYAREREAFGRPIIRRQGVGFKLADMASELRAAELMTLHAAWKYDQGTATDADIAMAKLKATEMLAMVADEAIQIHGGMGLMDELPLERIWRDARIERIWDGTSEIQRHIISRSLLRPFGG